MFLGRTGPETAIGSLWFAIEGDSTFSKVFATAFVANSQSSICCCCYCCIAAVGAVSFLGVCHFYFPFFSLLSPISCFVVCNF